ncbi:MAG: hypothetical protein JNJ45_08235 [Chthonomonas sp.]|nr:hypothetical protein [Chthonomonas sp.]
MKTLKLFMALMVLAVVAVGCGSKEEAPAATAAPTETQAPVANTPTGTDANAAAPAAVPNEATNTGVQDVRPDAAGQR